jgi:hypothetical protein
MRTDSPRTTFNHFQKFEKSWCIGGSAQYPWSASERNSIRILNFVLEFNVATGTALEDVHVNIVDLLRVTSYVQRLDGDIICSIPTGSGGAYTQHRYPLGRLRTDALIALSEFHREHPGLDSKKCPSVWMNGRGQIVEVEGAGRVTDPYSAIGEHSPRGDIVEEYRIKLDEDTDFDDWFWHHVYAPAPGTFFDGTLSRYLGWLQRVDLNGDRVYLAYQCKYSPFQDLQ